MPVVREQSVYNTSPADTGAAYTVGQPPTLPCRGVFRWILSICKCGTSHRLKELPIYSKDVTGPAWTSDMQPSSSAISWSSTSWDGQYVILANASDQHSWVYRRDNLCTTVRHELLLLLLTWPFHNALYRMTQDGDIMAKNSKSTWCHMVILLLHN